MATEVVSKSTIEQIPRGTTTQPHGGHSQLLGTEPQQLLDEFDMDITRTSPSPAYLTANHLQNIAAEQQKLRNEIGKVHVEDLATSDNRN